MVSAMIKNGQDRGRRVQNMTSDDMEYAGKFLDRQLMDAFRYMHPLVASDTEIFVGGN
jgi:hypothetical protein